MGIRLLTVPIERTFQSYLDMLSDAFGEKEPDVTEENIQVKEWRGSSYFLVR